MIHEMRGNGFKGRAGGGRGGSAIRNTGCSCRGPCLVLSTHVEWLTTACNSSSRRYNKSSGLLGHLYIFGICRHMHMNKREKIGKKKWGKVREMKERGGDSLS